MEFNSNRISESQKPIISAFKNLKNSFNDSCWNDEVKSSFESYINICDNNINKLENCVYQSEKICKELNNLNISNEINKLNKLIKDTELLISKANVLMFKRL